MKSRLLLTLAIAYPASASTFTSASPSVPTPQSTTVDACADNLTGPSIDFARLDRDFPHFIKLPRLDLAIGPLADRYRAVLALLPAEAGPLGPPVPSSADLARRYFFAGHDPFVIDDDQWTELSRRHPDHVVAARRSYAEFTADRPYLDGLLTEVGRIIAFNREISPSFPRVIAAVESHQLPDERSDVFSGWTLRPDFDLSGYPIEFGVARAHATALPLPVGGYGLRLNRNLRRTVQALSINLREGLIRDPRAPADATTDSPAVAHQIARFVTVAQLLNLVLIDRLGGATSADALVDELLTPVGHEERAPLTAFDERIRPRVVHAATVLGLRYPRPLIRNSSNHLGPRPAFAGELGRIAAQTGHSAGGLRPDGAHAELVAFRTVYRRVVAEASRRP